MRAHRGNGVSSQARPLTPTDRERMVRAVLDCGLCPKPPPRASSTPRRRLSPTGSSASASTASMVSATARQGLFPCRANIASHVRDGRGFAATALHSQTDCRRGRRFRGDGQRNPASPGPQQASALEPAEPIRRYERENPGDFIHVDIKKLARIGSVGHPITGRQRGDCRKAVLALARGRR